MKTLSVRCFCFVIALISGSASYAQDSLRMFHVGLIYPISNHGSFAGNYSNLVSVHALAGLSREERGFAVSGFALIVKENTNSFTSSGFINVIGGNATGFTSAGFTNIIGGNVNGFASSGFFNMYKNAIGLQAAGFMNLATESVTGVQAAGFMNTARDVHGVQAAGFLNRAENVNGAQIGFINIANSSKYSIGVINIIKDGEKSIGVSTDDNLSTMLTFRSGGKKIYGIIGLGGNLNNQKEVFALQTGLGAHFFSTEHFRLNTEMTWTTLESFKRSEDGNHKDFEKYAIAVLPSLQLGKVELFAGPSFNVIRTNSKEGYKMVDHYIWDHVSDSDHLTGFYIGYTAGVNFKF